MAHGQAEDELCPTQAGLELAEGNLQNCRLSGYRFVFQCSSFPVLHEFMCVLNPYLTLTAILKQPVGSPLHLEAPLWPEGAEWRLLSTGTEGPGDL